MLAKKLPASRAWQHRQSVSSWQVYPSWAASFSAAAQSSRTEPVICVSTFVSVFGVSFCKSARALSDRRRPYFSAIRAASSHVELSGYAGPEAIISSGSPRISESTMAKTLAGLASSANLPPFTPDRRLRMVFISTMSAPQARSCFVTSAISSSGISGHSKSAEPPPETRKSTVSSFPSGLTSSIAARVAR